ncbi:Nmad4 family putative nucleotide modification protein [Streptococcus suis]
MSKMTEVAKFYKIPTRTTPEDLEMKWGKVITYGESIILVGCCFHTDGHCYFAAIYEFLENDHSCEGFIGLREVSKERFIDDGHAIAWAFKQK